MKKPVYAISKSESQINRILNNLFEAGSSSYDICVLPPGMTPTRLSDLGRGEVPEGAMKSAGIGALVGAAIALLAGYDTFAMPGVFSMIAAGAGLGTLAAWVVSSSTWKIAVRLIRKGVWGLETESQLNNIPDGNFLICIRAVGSKDELRVKKIITEGGAQQIACA